jgi:hypothetical protein
VRYGAIHCGSVLILDVASLFSLGLTAVSESNDNYKIFQASATKKEIDGNDRRQR